MRSRSDCVTADVKVRTTSSTLSGRDAAGCFGMRSRKSAMPMPALITADSEHASSELLPETLMSIHAHIDNATNAAVALLHHDPTRHRVAVDRAVVRERSGCRKPAIISATTLRR